MDPISHLIVLRTSDCIAWKTSENGQEKNHVDIYYEALDGAIGEVVPVHQDNV